jgi:hypothetical protein
VLRTIGAQVATPDSNGDERRAAPSHANSWPISATEPAVPVAVTMNLLLGISFSEIHASISVPSDRVANESTSKALDHLKAIYSQFT